MGPSSEFTMRLAYKRLYVRRSEWPLGVGGMLPNMSNTGHARVDCPTIKPTLNLHIYMSILLMCELYRRLPLK